MAVISEILPNRVRLVAEQAATGKAAAIGFWFSVGSRDEHEGSRGITHFVEHMLFKGTQARSALEIARAFDRLGGYANAFSDHEYVCLYCIVPSVHTEAALDVLCDMCENAVFADDDIEKERSVIQSEILSALDDAEESGLDAVSAAVWPVSALAAPIAGSMAEVASISPEALKSWYHSHFSRGSLTVCIAGGVPLEAVRRRLCLLSVRSDCRQSRVQPLWKSGLSFIDADFRQEQSFLLFPISYPVDERLYFSYAILNSLIGDTMSSRLFQRLREEEGFCYTVYSYFTFYEDAGFWCAYVSSSRRDCLHVVAELLKELVKLISDTGQAAVRRDEIIAAKEHLCGEEIVSSEETEYRMKRMQRSLAWGFPCRSAEETAALIRSIKDEEIAEALLKLCEYSRAALVVYGPALTVKMKSKIEKNFECFKLHNLRS